jgi:hypothetical protein
MATQNQGGMGSTGNMGSGGGAGSSAGTSGSAGTGRQAGTGGAQATGAPDVTYNLVSILYHALHGAETYQQYIQDAEQAGNRELAQFFREVHDENRRRAERGQQLLAQCISQRGGNPRMSQ